MQKCIINYGCTTSLPNFAVSRVKRNDKSRHKLRTNTSEVNMKDEGQLFKTVKCNTEKFRELKITNSVTTPILNYLFPPIGRQLGVSGGKMN